MLLSEKDLGEFKLICKRQLRKALPASEAYDQASKLVAMVEVLATLTSEQISHQASKTSVEPIQDFVNKGQ